MNNITNRCIYCGQWSIDQPIKKQKSSSGVIVTLLFNSISLESNQGKRSAFDVKSLTCFVITNKSNFQKYSQLLQYSDLSFPPVEKALCYYGSLGKNTINTMEAFVAAQSSKLCPLKLVLERFIPGPGFDKLRKLRLVILGSESYTQAKLQEILDGKYIAWAPRVLDKKDNNENSLIELYQIPRESFANCLLAWAATMRHF